MLDTTNFEKILEENKRILLLWGYVQYRRIICSELIEAYEKLNQPIIVISRDIGFIDYVVYPTKKLVYKDLKYTAMDRVCRQGKSNLMLTFDCSKKGLLLELETALIANRILIEEEYEPLIVIDGFNDVYFSDTDIDLKAFYEEVIQENTGMCQPIVFVSNSFYNTEDINNASRFSEKIISLADCMITTQEIFKSAASALDINTIKETNNILDNIQKVDSKIKIKSQFKQMFDNDSKDITKTLLLDFNNGALNTI